MHKKQYWKPRVFRQMAAAAAVAAFGYGHAATAAAETFPNRPITLTVPYEPGATTDLIARAMGERMARELQSPVVVENKTGGNGIIAALHVSRSKADGYSFMLASDSTAVLNPLLYKKLSYSPDKDLTPIGLVSDLPLVMLVNTSLPARDLKEFVAYAHAHPGKLNFSSTGIGGTFHLSGELFNQMAGIQMTHVPYKGGAPAMQALVAREVQALFGVVGSALPQIKAGNVRALAVASKERLPMLPDVPTFAELGYPNFIVTVRYGFMAPAATPPDRISTLSAAMNTALNDPDFRKKFGDLGFVLPAKSSPQDYAALIQADRKMWADVIEAKNISLDN
jgi:tripartite-type tricarboxylate transporter receptor subunit TctC